VSLKSGRIILSLPSRLREGLGEGLSDSSNDALNSSGDFNSGEAEDLKSSSAHPRISPGIVGFRARGLVRGAIHLDDQPLAQATKVGDVWTERMLAAKLGFGAAGAQRGPKDALWNGSRTSKLSTALNVGLRPHEGPFVQAKRKLLRIVCSPAQSCYRSQSIAQLIAMMPT
jgi:hypothetical protein